MSQKKAYSNLEKEVLIELLLVSSGTLEKKKYELKKAREKLSFARKRMRKMKDIILYQRTRILGESMSQ